MQGFPGAPQFGAGVQFDSSARVGAACMSRATAEAIRAVLRVFMADSL